MSIENKLVSVVMPTYNVAKFIKESVYSILNQTYKNIEFVIVDDFSTDGTYEILLELASLDNRIKLFRNPVNSKIAKSLNYGLKVATGHYIARMDGDDISVLDRIEKQVAYLIANPEIHLAGINMILINESGEEIKRVEYFSKPQNSYKLITLFSPVPHFWLTYKWVYDQVGEYRIPKAEDYDFLLRMTTMKLNFCNVQDYLIKYRIRDGNTATHSGLEQRKLLQYGLNLYKERVKSNSLKDSYSDSEFERIRNSSKLEEFIFSISNYFLFKCAMNKDNNKLFAIFYLFLSVCFSPFYQSMYFVRKYKYNKIIINDLNS